MTRSYPRDWIIREQDGFPDGAAARAWCAREMAERFPPGHLGGWGIRRYFDPGFGERWSGRVVFSPGRK